MRLCSSKQTRKFAWICIAIMVVECLTPMLSYALTGGPSTPEVQSFSPIGTSEMVDLSTGDFNYNLPLLDVSGYPINLVYNAGITMDQEASMVGLGWNINPGVINRNIRALPDDFNGVDKIHRTINLRPNRTYGASGGLMAELFGVGTKAIGVGLKASLGVFYNNYKGIGFEFGVTPSLSAASKSTGKLTLGLGLHSNSQEGVTITPNLSYSMKFDDELNNDRNLGLSLGAPIHTTQGLKAVTLGVNPGLALLSGSTSYSFSNPTYIPHYNFTMNNFSLTLAASAGGAMFGMHLGGSVTGYYTVQTLAKNKYDINAYGYMFSHLGQDDEFGIMDFNREKDGPFSKDIPHLPITISGNDIYSLSGQGIGGSFQLKRGDVGTFKDNKSGNFSFGGSLGLEFGVFPNLTRFGADVQTTITNSKTGSWTNNNFARSPLSFLGPLKNNPGYEATYFKAAGEMSVNDESENLFETMGKFQPVRVRLFDPVPKSFTDVFALNILENSDFNQVSLLTNNSLRRTSREKRNQSVSYLSAEQASIYGVSKTINYYDINTQFSFQSNTSSEDRINYNRKPHHISEITALREDGLRYIYGLPAYNNEQKTVSFSVNGQAPCHTGLFENYGYDDHSVKNKKGTDHYFNEERTDPYAYAYLLTNILSEDYVDIDDNGPSPNDYGTYTKFNYNRIHENYGWRVPFNNANFNPGLLSDQGDNKANYLAGKKEIYLVHSIESKTQEAKFYYSRRNDSYGALVDSIKGGIDNSAFLYKLDSIALFSKSDQAIPIKTVHFEYSYELCPGIDNNASGEGKLTLNKVFFTFGKSRKGRLSPYEFSYDAISYGYNMRTYNRWGNYQPLDLNNGCSNNPNNPKLTPTDFPWVVQDTQKANEYAAAWNLTRIKLPSGGEITVNYESDDYAYVQDKRAMQMFNIVHMSDKGPAQGGFNLSNDDYSDLYTQNSPLSSQPNPNHNYIYFELEENYSINKAELYHRYLAGIGLGGFVYFKCLAKLNDTERHEYIPGYAKLIDYGLVNGNQSSGKHYGYIKVEEVDKYNPIAITAMQFVKLNLPEAAFKQSQMNEGSTDSPNLEQVGLQLAAMVGNIAAFVNGFYDEMRLKKYCQKVYKPKSFIRLNNPNFKKLGGGHRVHKISISDNWKSMAGQSYTNQSYGQIYEYTTTYRHNGIDRIISSGVAAYEPIIGGDENPLKQPIPYTDNLKFAPDNYHYQELPLGEGYYPAPTVIYSKVSVRSIHQGATRSGTGKTVHEYFTAKDYPVISKSTNVDTKPKRTKPILRLLKLKHKESLTASEGFVIELNDMHGKPKAQHVYDQYGTRISGITYHYKDNNYIKAIKPDGEVLNNSLIGVEYQMMADSRESETKTRSFGMNGNTDNFVIGLPIATFTLFPSFSSELTKFRSIVLTKVIHRAGILEKTTAFDLGSSVTTQNIAFDYESGAPILTKTFNEFKDPIYNLNFPAHWAYSGMENAYKNIMAEFDEISFIPYPGNSNEVVGKLKAGFGQYFEQGDEVVIWNSNQLDKRGWVLWKDGDHLYLIDKNGKNIDLSSSTPFGGYNIQILRSGKRNKHSTPVGSVTALDNLINSNDTTEITQDNRILESSAIQYSDQWQTHCCEDEILAESNNDDCCDRIDKYISEFGVFGGLPSRNNAEFINGLNDWSTTGSNCSQTWMWTPNNKGFSTRWANQEPLRTCNLGAAIIDAEYLINDLQCNSITSAAGVLISPPIDLSGYKGPLFLHFNSSHEIDDSGTNMTIGINPTTASDFAVLTNTIWNKKSLSYSDCNPVCVEIDPKLYSKEFVILFAYRGGTGYWMIDNVRLLTQCVDDISCCDELENDANSNEITGSVTNPFLRNIKGVWRPERSYAYLTDRVQQTTASSNTNIRTDGIYQNDPLWSPYTYFYQKQGNKWNSGSASNWTWTSMVTQVSPIGAEIENKDALDRYSAEQLGYFDQKVVAVASNARHQDIAFDGAEDITYNDKLNKRYKTCQNKKRIGWPIIGVDSERAHSGKVSYSVPGSGVTFSDPIAITQYSSPYHEFMKEWELHEGDCITKFSPTPGKYVISAWVQEQRNENCISFDGSELVVEIVNGPTYTFNASGNIIEGWQRIYGEFTIPIGTDQIRLGLKGNNGISTNFDDLRIHPYNASFKSYVYDDVNLRLTHELDENNFMTIYEYDQSGNLERIKKETERGIMTIQESRFSNVKK